MARKVSAQVATRNLARTWVVETRAALEAAAAILAPRLAELEAAEAELAEAEAEDVAAVADVDADDEWFQALLNLGDSPAYQAAEARVKAARIALVVPQMVHDSAVRAHEKAVSYLENAEQIIRDDRRARFKAYVLPHLDD